MLLWSLPCFAQSLCDLFPTFIHRGQQVARLNELAEAAAVVGCCVQPRNRIFQFLPEQTCTAVGRGLPYFQFHGSLDFLPHRILQGVTGAEDKNLSDQSPTQMLQLETGFTKQGWHCLGAQIRLWQVWRAKPLTINTNCCVALNQTSEYNKQLQCAERPLRVILDPLCSYFVQRLNNYVSHISSFFR